MQPDCADLPYFLRAYFAFKMGLPFGYSKCTRGGGGKAAEVPAVVEHPERGTSARNAGAERPPAVTFLFGVFGRCGRADHRRPSFSRPPGLVPGFGYYLRTTVANGVHSGSGRTAADDDNTDYYPVPLKQETLRPGTIYADPYGHVLVLVSASRRRTTRRAFSSPSMGSPTARSRASASGAAISCSHRTRRSAARASSASARSSPRRTAACGG